jgi:hypothetical protein
MNVKVQNADVKSNSNCEIQMNVIQNCFQGLAFGDVKINPACLSKFWIQLNS